MKPSYLLAGGVLAALLSGAAAAQFNTDALKKMQKEGHKILEEQQAAEAAGGNKAPAARRAYRVGADLCLDGQGSLTVETCNGKAASQQWILDASGRLVANDGRCLAGANLVKCAQGNPQKWVHDDRGRLRNAAQQCLQARSVKAGAAVTTAACGAAPTQVWVAQGAAK